LGVVVVLFPPSLSPRSTFGTFGFGVTIFGTVFLGTLTFSLSLLLSLGVVVLVFAAAFCLFISLS